MTKSINIFGDVIRKINIFLLAIVVFLIPINHKFISPFIGLWAITSIILNIIQKEKLIPNKSQISLIVFYTLLLIGLFWTDNKSSGGFDLEVKMSLIIFPTLFLFLNLSKFYIQFIIYSFLSGILFGAVYLFYQAYQVYSVNQVIDSLFYVNLSTIIHPSYMSFYVITALLVLLIDMKYRVLILFKNDMFSVGIIILLFVFNLFLLSRIGIILGLLIILYFTMFWIIRKNKYVLGVGVLLGLVFSIYFAYENSPYTKQRLHELIEGLTIKEGPESNSSAGIRLKIWNEGATLIAERPILGHGTGDVKDVLLDKYELNGIKDAYHKKLNAHNQFIQVGIGLGILGLLVFLAVFFFSIKGGFLTQNYFIVGFIVVSLVFMIPESVLEKQAGTIFFGLFISLLNQKPFSKLQL